MNQIQLKIITNLMFACCISFASETTFFSIVSFHSTQRKTHHEEYCALTDKAAYHTVCKTNEPCFSTGILLSSQLLKNETLKEIESQAFSSGAYIQQGRFTNNGFITQVWLHSAYRGENSRLLLATFEGFYSFSSATFSKLATPNMDFILSLANNTCGMRP